jgi:signal transduction histidine kinase/ActR/RegA family two-component response regulator
VKITQHLPVVVVIVLGIVISVAAFFYTTDQYRVGYQRQKIEERAAPHALIVGRVFDRYLEIIHSIGGLFSASDNVDRKQFGAFVNRALERYPGIQALEWIPRVRHDERAAYEARARRDGLGYFHITERGGSGEMVPTGKREDYYPVYFVEPLNGNERAVGFDLGSNPERRQALEKARDSGSAVGTQRIKLVQETGRQFGFLVFVPAYSTVGVPATLEERREKLTGFALGVFRIGDILESTMEGKSALTPFDIYLIDEEAAPGKRLLHYLPSPLHSEETQPSSEAELLENSAYSAGYEVAGRSWRIHFKDGPGQIHGTSSPVPWSIGVVGLLLTLLLVLYLIASRDRTRVVERLVQERRRELDEANQALEAEMAERQSMQQQLSQAQKMEAIGQLTGGIAHDFNNLLMVIDGYSRRALQTVADSSESVTALNAVLSASDKATKLTTQLLSFSRRRILDKSTFGIGPALSEVGSLLKRSVGEQYNLRFDIECPDAFVKTDAGEFGQALLNLSINARDAMPDGGEIVVGVREVGPGNEFIANHPSLEAGRFVVVSVKDEGHGIDPEVLPRIFEPFFTTKEQGQGTGLGLSMVYGFSQQSDGALDVRSEVGKGTIFEIYLPIAERPSQQEIAEVKKIDYGKGETILLVEDDGALLELTGEILKDLGYKVLKASDGIEALEVDGEYQGLIDVMLSDVVMPSISGFEVAEIVRENRPDIKVVFMSGYPNRGRKKNAVVPKYAQFLQKPVNANHLAHVIRCEIEGTKLPLAG